MANVSHQEWPGRAYSYRVGPSGTIQPGDGDPRHGTVNGYRNLSCGKQSDGSRRKACGPCKEAWRVKHLEYMYRHPEQLERHRLYEIAKREERKRLFGTPYEQL